MQLKRQLGYHLLQIGVVSLEGIDLLAGGITGRVATQTLFACLHELLGPRVEVVGLDASATTQLIDCHLATEALQDYVDILFCGVLPASC